MNSLNLSAQCEDVLKKYYPMNVWQGLEKPSHPNKSLKKHLDEVRRYFNEITMFFNLHDTHEDLKKILDIVIDYHDMGKLHKDWCLNGCRSGHSENSAVYLLQHLNNLAKDYKDILDSYLPLILYLILKHHSILARKDRIFIRSGKLSPCFDPELFPLAVDYILDSGLFQDYKNRVDLVDLYGAFKLADIFSANFRPLNLNKLDISTRDVEKIIGDKLNKYRFNIQVRIANSRENVFIRAPTGWGKTSTSLLYSVGKDVSRVFILLPTVTAVNKFYEKLSRVFRGQVGFYYYMYDAYLYSKTASPFDEELLDRLRDSFFIRNFILNYINITSIDQFLLSFIQVRKYFIKRLVFRNSLIIMDEVHLLTPSMMKVFTWILKNFAKHYKLKLLIMSATFPINLMKYIVECGSVRPYKWFDLSDGYKSLRRVIYTLEDKDIANSLQDIVSDVENGLKVLVMVNTVDKAVEIGKRLIEILGMDKVIILHSRFMFRHRVGKEDRIYSLKDTPHVLVSTQVAEVSLDISYDRLYTELASLPSLIQRFGRVNRYGKETAGLNVRIFKVYEASRRYPYSNEDLELAWEILRKYEGNHLKNEYQMIQELDSIMTYDEFVDYMERESSHMPLEEVTSRHKFFYSLDVKDDDMKKLLEYRESFTTLVLPHPDMINENYIQLRNDIEKLIDTDYRLLSEEERLIYEAKVKASLINIPYYLFLKSYDEYERKGFPIILLDNYEYDPIYGLTKVEVKIK